MEHDDPVHVYRAPKAAAARWARLRSDLDGGGLGIDYAKRMETFYAPSNWECGQDIRDEKVQEINDLTECLRRASAAVGWDTFRVWLIVRVIGHTQAIAAEHEDVSVRTVRRTLARADQAVRDALSERQMVEGYQGRDLLYVRGNYERGVKVWFNEFAWSEVSP